MTQNVHFKGVNLSNYVKIMNVTRGILPARSLSTLSVAGRAGAYFYGKKVDPAIFEVEVMFIGDVAKDRRDLAAVLDSDVPVPLVFSEEPDLTYYAMLIDETEVEQLLHTGRATLTFIALDPYAYGDEYAFDFVNISNHATTLEVDGQVETFPTVRVTFKEKSEFFAIGAGDDLSDRSVMVGQAPDVEEDVVEHEELILNDPLSTISGWTKVTTSSLEGGTAQQDMASDGTRFFVPDYGTGTAWHGAAYKKALSEPLQDFLVQARFTQRSTDVRAVGRVELHLLDSGNNIVAKLTMRDSDPQAYVNYGLAQIGQGSARRSIINRKDRRFNFFERGILRMRRVGNRFSAQIARLDPTTGRTTFQVTEFYTDVNRNYQQPITQVQIHIAGHGSSPKTLQFADEVKVWKVNDFDAETEVPEIFEAGDVLEIDMARNRVLKNGVPFMQYVNPLSRFFSLRAGNNAIAFASGGECDIQVKYNSRWY